MMRLAWLTDIHVDSCNATVFRSFCDEMAASEADAFLLTGDIATARSVGDVLTMMGQAVAPKPIHFLCGNHDYYGGSVADVRRDLAKLSPRTKGEPQLFHLNNVGFTKLTDTTALVGHDGWYDGENGDYWGTRFALNDFLMIGDLRSLDVVTQSGNFISGAKERMKPVLERLTREGATWIERGMRAAIASGHTKLIVATHVPPFEGAAWHLGKPSDSYALPWFSNKMVGEAIMQVANEHPDVDVLVLCGHSHSPGTYKPGPNVKVLTGHARYGSPEIQSVLELT